MGEIREESAELQCSAHWRTRYGIRRRVCEVIKIIGNMSIWNSKKENKDFMRTNSKDLPHGD